MRKEGFDLGIEAFGRSFGGLTFKFNNIQLDGIR